MAVVGRLERGEPLMPPGDASVAVTDSLIRDLISSHLPLEAEVEGFHVRLQRAEVTFRGNAVVRLRGTLEPHHIPGLEAQVDVLGALEGLAVDPLGSILSARIAIDHFSIERVAGLGSLLGGSALDEVARLIRLKVEDRLPKIHIPIRVQQTIDLPAVTRGPVRIEGASLPLKVTVSEVMAVRGRLWVALHFEPGEMTKTAEAPEAADTTASETGFSLEPNGGEPSGKASSTGPGKGN